MLHRWAGSSRRQIRPRIRFIAVLRQPRLHATVKRTSSQPRSDRIDLDQIHATLADGRVAKGRAPQGVWKDARLSTGYGERLQQRGDRRFAPDTSSSRSDDLELDQPPFDFARHVVLRSPRRLDPPDIGKVDGPVGFDSWVVFRSGSSRILIDTTSMAVSTRPPASAGGAMTAPRNNAPAERVSAAPFASCQARGSRFDRLLPERFAFSRAPAVRRRFLILFPLQG
jgi:hypothetical protein